jgi:cytochrome c-type biogenesis protein CcmH
MRRAALIALLLLVAAPAPAGAAAATWSVADLESQVMCPVCNTLVSNSQSSVAIRIRQIIVQKHAQGWSEARTRDYLVAQFGEEILAAPPKRGFDLLAWVIPGAVLVGGAAIAFALARAWARGRDGGPPAGPPPVDDAMGRRIDAALAGDEP